MLWIVSEVSPTTYLTSAVSMGHVSAGWSYRRTICGHYIWHRRFRWGESYTESSLYDKDKHYLTCWKEKILVRNSWTCREQGFSPEQVCECIVPCAPEPLTWTTDTTHIRSSHCIPLDGCTLLQSSAFTYMIAEMFIQSKRLSFYTHHR